MPDRTDGPPLDNPPTGRLWWDETAARTRTPDPPRRVPTEPDPLLPAGEESDWIAAAQAGDRQAFGRLVERYWDRLYRWLYHLTRDRHKAEDLVQETFLKALAALDSFRPGSNFRAWLFRIGHNNFVNLKRAERRTGHPLPEDAAGPPVGRPAGDGRRPRGGPRWWRRRSRSCRSSSGRP